MSEDFLEPGTPEKAASPGEAADRKRIETERETAEKFLCLLNERTTKEKLLEDVLRFFHERSGCEALGVRLKEGDDYPYYEARGFPQEFILLESSLCARDAAGRPLHDASGHPIMECMCGNVIQGRFDPSKPFFSARGSFWTNSTTELLATTTEKDRQSRTRDRCNGEGYESVALIPLRAGGRTLGLLQLNDREKGRFSPGLIDYWERLAGYLTATLAKIEAEEALEKSEERFRNVFEAGLIGMAITSLKKGFVDVNQRICDMLGYDRQELMRVSWVDLTHPDDRAGDADLFARLLSGEIDSCSHEKRYIRKDGAIVHASVSVRGVRRPGGALEYLVALVEDITGLKQADERLRASEDKFRTAFATGADAFLIAGRDDGRIDDVNDRFLKLYGYTREEVIGRTSLELGMWAVPGARERILEELKTRGYVRNLETLARRKGGEEFWIVCSVSELKTQGQPLVLEAIRDVTERRKMENALRESETRLRAILEGSRDAIVVSRDRIRVFVNPAYVSLLGFDSADELIGKSILDLVAPESVGFVTEIWKKDAAGKAAPVFYEAMISRKDGSKFLAEIAVSSYVLEGQLFAVGVLRDITERRRLEEQLHHAQKMEAVGTLAGGIAHDFNNILTVIMGLGNVIQMSVGPEDKIRPLIDQIVLSSRRAADLTQSLLAFSRKQRILLEPHNVNSLVVSTAKLLKRLLTEDITLSLDLSPEDSVALVDISQIDQVLMNLASNARDAMPRGGSLAIRTELCSLDETSAIAHGLDRPGKYVRISVSDTGVGMDERTMARIFDPFFTTKAVGKGTGLGLASAYGIMKQHGGCITVTSAPGKGTTFDVYLPLVDVAALHAAAASPVTAKGSETILVLEDDSAVRSVITRILSVQGYKTIEAANGDDALREFEKHGGSIDLVILDVVMPGKNGKEVFDEMARVRPATKAIFMSGYTGDVVIDKGVERENVDFLQKPLSLNMLLEKVREVLDR
jgi:PAS domain S-box-containing protein